MSKQSQRERQLRRELSFANKRLAELESPPAVQVVGTTPPPGTVIRRESLSVQSFSGPLPPPKVLGDYEAIAPGTAERIIAIFEKQAIHRMDLEKTVVKGGARRSWGGLIVGGAIAAGGLVVAALAVQANQPWAAGSIVAAVFGAGLWAFLNGTASQMHERQERTKQLANKKKQ